MNDRPIATPPSERSSRILAVDDEALARTLLQRHLQKQGHEVVAVASVAEAQDRVNRHGVKTFDCVVTDYLMPEQSGLELLAWIKEQDPSLSVIMVTAQGERETVARTLRGGATDFLDKPVAPDDLRQAVGRGIKSTNHQRRLKETATEVAALGEVQQLLVGLHADQFLDDVQLHFHPKHQAGGDFACSKRLPDGRRLVLLADVSGHDLKAAYVSAYFQGVLQGMIAGGQDVPSILDYFNKWLLAVSDSTTGGIKRPSIASSLSVCAIVIDEESEIMTVINHGSPIPFLARVNGPSFALGETGGWPLGWFPDAGSTNESWPLAAGRLYLWTDGLEESAAQQDVSPLAMATRLERDRKLGHPSSWLAQAPDDVLLLVVDVQHEAGSSDNRFDPVLCESYAGSRVDEIDSIQSRWEHSLKFAIPTLDRDRLYDVLLCSREAVINALTHGCGKKDDCECIFQLYYNFQSGTIRVLVSDPGSGHDFDHEQHSRRAAEEMIDRHRGLTLMHCMASRIETRRNGAELIMEFHCPCESSKLTHEI